MERTRDWPWTRSLAMLDEGRLAQVDEILFRATRDHCGALGLREGVMVTCTANDQDGVEIELASGERARVPRPFAWFVSVAKR